jgi:hypothetical protein
MFYKALPAVRLLAITVLALTLSAEIFAGPPAPANCDDPDVFARLTCRQAAIAEQAKYTADTAFAEGTVLRMRTDPNRMAYIEGAKAQTRWAKDHNDAASFKRQVKASAKGNAPAGHLIPLDEYSDLNPPGGDGICDYEQGDPEALCAAIELDADGFLQACNPEKKNKGKGGKSGNSKFDGLECDRFFADEVALSVPEVEAAEQLEASYTAVESNLNEMNGYLDDVNDNVPSEQEAILLFESDEEGCFVPQLTPGLDEWAFGLREVHAVLEGAGNIKADLTGQTVVLFGNGGNVRSGAAIFHSIAMLANIAYIAVDEVNKMESEQQQNAIMDCVNQSAGEVAAVQTEILELRNQLDLAVVALQEAHQAIQDNDDLNTAELIRLLHTPEGMRTSERPVCSDLPCSWPYVPENWPDPPGDD